MPGLGVGLRHRFFAHLAAAGASAGVCIATLIEPQWFELLFDSAPDGGDGSLQTWVAVRSVAYWARHPFGAASGNQPVRPCGNLATIVNWRSFAGHSVFTRQLWIHAGNLEFSAESCTE